MYITYVWKMQSWNALCLINGSLSYMSLQTFTELEPQTSGRNYWHVNSYWTISKGEKKQVKIMWNICDPAGIFSYKAPESALHHLNWLEEWI